MTNSNWNSIIGAIKTDTFEPDFNHAKKRTGKIFKKILAAFFVFFFGVSMMPYNVDSVYADGRGRYVFPRDTDSMTTGISFAENGDALDLRMTINNAGGIIKL